MSPNFNLVAGKKLDIIHSTQLGCQKYKQPQQKAFEKQQNKENQEYGANSKKEACSIDHHDLIQYTNNLARKAA